MSEYNLIGKNVRVHLYDRRGLVIGILTGRVADVAKGVPVGKDEEGREIKKDLAYVVDIQTSDPDVPFQNSAGEENEGWFALQDVQVLRDDLPSHISFN